MECECGICNHCQNEGLRSKDGLCFECDVGDHQFLPKVRVAVNVIVHGPICFDCNTKTERFASGFRCPLCGAEFEF